MPIKAPEMTRSNKFFFMSLKEMFVFFIKVMSKRNATPTKPLTQAMTLEGRGIYFTKIPIVPNIVIARMSFVRARPKEAEFFVEFICIPAFLKVHKAYFITNLPRYIYNLLFFEKVYIIPSVDKMQKKGYLL